MKESELYPLIKSWLEDQGYEVFAEVPFKGTGRYIDVVGINWLEKKSIAVELKTSYNYDVKVQAQFNSSYFDQSFIAIPKKQRAIEEVAKFFGVLEVDLSSQKVNTIALPTQKRGLGYSFDQLKSRLFINQINKELSGGVEITKVQTSYKTSINNVIEYLKVHGPTDLKTLVKEVNLHWSQPESNLRSALTNLEAHRFGVDRSSRPYRYFYKENTEGEDLEDKKTEN